MNSNVEMIQSYKHILDPSGNRETEAENGKTFFGIRS